MADDNAIHRHLLEMDVDLVDINRINAETLTPLSTQDNGNLSLTEQSSNGHPTSVHQDPQEDLSLEEYFQRFVLENQEQMNETELAKKLGISRKCLWERRQRVDMPRVKPAGKSANQAADNSE